MVGLMLLIFDLSCCFSGAYGTSTFLLSGSGVDGRFLNMPFSAFPPYPLVTSRRYHFWGQTAVQRAIPLRGDFRMKRSIYNLSFEAQEKPTIYCLSLSFNKLLDI